MDVLTIATIDTALIDKIKTLQSDDVLVTYTADFVNSLPFPDIITQFKVSSTNQAAFRQAALHIHEFINEQDDIQATTINGFSATPPRLFS
jgi:hypothetical protein